MTLAGTQQLTISGAVTDATPTTLSGATLNFGAIGATFGTSAFTINSGTISTAATLTTAPVNSITFSSNASLTLAASGAFALTLAGPVTLSGTDTITVTDPSNATLTGAVTGTGAGLTVAGSTTLFLQNAGDNFSGPVVVNSGTLDVNGAAGALTAASSLTVNTGGTLTADDSTHSATNRLPATAPVFLAGGTLTFVG